MNLPIIIIGAGEHAKILVDLIDELGLVIMGVTSPQTDKEYFEIEGRFEKIKILGSDEVILEYSPEEVELVMGLAGLSTMRLRTKIFNQFKEKGYTFRTLVHPTAFVSKYATLGEGAQILAGSTINVEAVLGKMVCVNTNSSLDHGVIAEDFTNIACGVTLAGNVSIGTGSYIGAGSTVIEKVSIGSYSLLAAGSLVIQDLTNGSSVKGVPAKLFQSQFSLS